MCFISSSAAAGWERLLASIGIDWGVCPPPEEFNDMYAFIDKADTMKTLFQTAEAVEQQQHQVQPTLNPKPQTLNPNSATNPT